MVMQPGDYFKQVCIKLSNQGRLRNDNSRNVKLEDKKNISENEEIRKQKTTFQKGNTIEYALYLLCKELYLSPVWMLLMSGEYQSWNELCTTYYTYYKYERTNKYAINPITTLILILKFKECPTIIKELLTQNELALISSPDSIPSYVGDKLQNNKDFDDDQYEVLKYFQKQSTQILKEQEQILKSIFGIQITSFTKLAHKVNFPPKILKLIVQFDNQYNKSKNQSENEKASDAVRDIDKYLTNAIESNPSLNFSSSNEIYNQVKNLFYYLDADMCDYRSKGDSNRMNDIQEKYGFNQIMQLIVTSTLSNLQTAYQGYQGFTDRYDEHNQLVSYEIDLLLSTLEQFYFFLDGMKEFNKFKLYQILGLASGFIIESSDYLNCKPQLSMNNYKKYDDQAKDKMNNKKLITQEQRIKHYVNNTLYSLRDSICYRYEDPYSKRLSQPNSSNQNLIKKVIENNDEEEEYFRFISYDVYFFFEDEKKIKEIEKNYTYTFERFFLDKVINFDDYISKSISLSYGETLLKFVDESFTKEIFITSKSKEIFQFLIDLFKENYSSFINHFYFNINKENDMKFIEALLYLNSVNESNKPEFQYQQFTDSLQIVTQNLISNKKSLIQLLSLLLNDIEYNLSCIQDVIQVKSFALNNFLKITLNQEMHDVGSILELILSETSYSYYNKNVIKQIALLYTGDVNKLMDIVKYSSNFCDTNYHSFKFLYKFLQAIDFSHFHTIENVVIKPNILNTQFISSEKETNQILQNEILLQLCITIIFGETENQEHFCSDSKSGLQIKQTSLYTQAKIIGDICQNKWDFIWNSKDTEFYSNYKEAFNELFGIPKTSFCLIELISMLKSEQSGFGSCININSYLDSNQQQQFIKDIDDCLYLSSGKNQQEIEQFNKQLELLIIFSSKSFPHLVDFLNQLSNNRGTNFQDLIQIEEKKVGTNLQENEEISILPNEISRILQSILMTKFSTQYNWYEVYKYIQNYVNGNQDGVQLELENEKINQESEDIQKQNVQKYRKLIKNVFQGYDTFSEIFIKYITEDQPQSNQKQIEKDSNNSGENSKNALGNKNIIQRVIQMIETPKSTQNRSPRHSILNSKPNQYEYFDLKDFLEQSGKKVKEAHQKSPRILYYMIESHYLKKEIELDHIKNIGLRFNKNNFKVKTNSDPKKLDQFTIQMMTSLLIGEPFTQLSQHNKLIFFMQKASQIFLESINLNEQLDLENIAHDLQSKNDNKNNLENLVNNILPAMGKLFILTYYSKELSTTQKEFFSQQFKSLKSLVILEGDNIQVSETNLIEIKYFINKIAKIIGQKMQNGNDDRIGNYIIELLLKQYDQIGKVYSKEKLTLIFDSLFSLLNNPIINLQDFKVLDELIVLLEKADNKYINNGFIKNIFVLIIKGEVNCLFNIMEYFKILPTSDIAILKSSISKIKSFTMYSGEQNLESLKNSYQPIMSDQMKDIAKRVEEGKNTIMDIFQSIDNQGDRNQLISLSEFCNFLKRTGIQMSEHRINELFATIKKNRHPDENSDGDQLNYEEFEEAYNYITQKKTDMSLQQLGISPTLLALSLVILVVILVLLLVFIFLGIKAFSLGGTFGSIVNSIIPVVSAFGASKSQSDKKDSLKQEKIEGAVKQTQAIINNNEL